MVNILQLLWGPTQDGRRVTNTAYRVQNSSYVTEAHFNMRNQNLTAKTDFFFLEISAHQNRTDNLSTVGKLLS